MGLISGLSASLICWVVLALCVGFYVWNVTSLVLGGGGCGGVFRAFGFGYYVWWFSCLVGGVVFVFCVWFCEL